MITLIMLSWDRIDNVCDLVKEYKKYDRINEIIIFNNNNCHDLKPFLDFTNKKVKLIQSTADMGLYTRFAAASLTSNACILFTDDDILLPEATIEELYSKWTSDRQRCFGTYGRSVDGGYSVKDTYGPVKVILTRCLMTNKGNCINALKLTPKFSHLASIPKGNGEDIILSYTAILSSGKLNLSYRLPTVDLPGHKYNADGTSSSIHKRWPDHYKHRQKVVNICEQLLRQKRKRSLWEKIFFPFHKRRKKKKPIFTDSTSYWRKRYKSGGTSGAGSYNRLAEFKAAVINEFVAREKIGSVIELGCGDGNQVTYFQVPSYTGFDVSNTAVKNCSEKFKNDKSKSFFHISKLSGHKADLSLSLDVIYHLIEDDIFHKYMQQLFAAADRYVIIYSCNTDVPYDGALHVKPRVFTDWIEKNQAEFQLIKRIPNRYPYEASKKHTTSFSEFYIYEKLISN